MSVDQDKERKDKRDAVYNALQKRYDGTLERRKTLTGQAASLMAFAGIIQTILVGLLTTIATNANAKQLLSTNTNFLDILTLTRWGFGFYIATVVFAVFAFIEPRWDIAPIPVGGTVREQIDQWNQLYRSPDLIDLSDYQLQLITATEDNRKVNKWKFLILAVAYAFLIAGIVSTGIVGYFIATGMTLP